MRGLPAAVPFIIEMGDIWGRGLARLERDMELESEGDPRLGKHQPVREASPLPPPYDAWPADQGG